MAKVNPNSPYLGIRGGYKGGGRPKKFERTVSATIGFTREQFDYIKSRGIPFTDYIRKLIDADMQESRYIEQFSQGNPC